MFEKLLQLLPEKKVDFTKKLGFIEQFKIIQQHANNIFLGKDDYKTDEKQKGWTRETGEKKEYAKSTE